MAVQLIAKGTGEPRNVVLIYHIDPTRTGPKLAAAAPGWLVAVETGPPFKNFYRNGGGMTALPQALAQLQKLGGFDTLGLLVLAGFSEGCQGVRAQLLAGHDPSGVLALDGIHASQPPDDAGQLKPWRDYCARAKARQRYAILTHTAIVPPGYLATGVVVPLVAQLGPGASKVQALDPPHVVQNEGWLWVDSWPGADAAAHVQQQTEVLPHSLAFLAENMPPDAASLVPRIAGSRPPAGGGGGAPPGGQSGPPAGQGAPPGGQGAPPGGQAKPPPGGRPPAVQKTDDDGGAGALFLAGLGLAALAALK